MSWNYRVVKETYRKGTATEEVGYEIREAYYNEDGTIWGITEDSKGLYGESLDDLKKGCHLMALSLDKDIIDLDTFVFAKPDFDNGDIDWDRIDEEDFDAEFAEQLKKLEEDDAESQ